MIHKVWVLAVLSLVLVTLGCKVLPDRPSRPARLPRPIIEVSVDKDLAAKRTVTVDLIGVMEVERYLWDTKKIDDYWQPRDRLRTEAVTKTRVRVMEFPSGQDTKKVHTGDDPPWDNWEENRVRFIFVIADIPDVDKDDARRLVIDREQVRGKTVEIRVTKEKLDRVR